MVKIEGKELFPSTIKVDVNNRFTIPVEVRERLNITPGDFLEVFFGANRGKADEKKLQKQTEILNKEEEHGNTQ